MARLELRLVLKYDRVFPTRFQNDYYILDTIRKQYIQLIDKHFSGQSDAILVDYGCGDMPYRRFFEPYVSEYLGIDLPTAHAIGFKQDADFFIDEDGRVPDVPDNYADYLFSSAVLEHVDDPAVYLDECYRMLKPGGTALISTLFYWIYHAVPDDYWRWTPTGLRKELLNAGFEIIEVRGAMGLLSVSVQLFQDAIRDKFPTWLRPYFIVIMQWLVQIADMPYNHAKYNPNTAAYTYIVRKPAEKSDE
jgi:SAM-dependent methyltransferase